MFFSFVLVIVVCVSFSLTAVRPVLFSFSLEVMVHRRLLRDDFRGVGEALNETGMCLLSLSLFLSLHHSHSYTEPLSRSLHLSPDPLFLPITGLNGDGLIIRTVHRIVLSAPGAAAKRDIRSAMEDLAHSPVLAFSLSSNDQEQAKTNVPIFYDSTIDGVHMETFQVITTSFILVISSLSVASLD